MNYLDVKADGNKMNNVVYRKSESCHKIIKRKLKILYNCKIAGLKTMCKQSLFKYHCLNEDILNENVETISKISQKASHNNNKIILRKTLYQHKNKNKSA